MRVLQLTTHLNIGGIANYILALSVSLKDRGVSVIVASGGGELESEFYKHGISHKRIDIMTKSELSPKILKAIWSVRRIIKEERIDIIHAHTRVSQVVAFFVSRLTGVTYITTCHGFFKTRFRRIFDTWGAAVIAISDAVKDHLESDLGVDEGRIQLIYSGIDIDRFSKAYSADEIRNVKKLFGLKEDPVVGTIGRLSPVKGQRFLVEAMKGVIQKKPHTQALIVGDGPEEELLKNLARDLDMEGSVHFLRSDLDTHKLLSAMDVFVLPSIKEGLGIALLEALAAGKACVASDVGGIGDIIRNNSLGLLVKVADPKGMADAILTLLEDKDLRNRMGDNGRALVKEKFSLRSMTDKIEILYKEVVKG